MDCTELKRMEQYAWLIPQQPKSLGEVIKQITDRLHGTQIESKKIPNLKMHRYNAFHLPKNEELKLTTEQLKIKALKIPITPDTEPYVLQNFVPVSCECKEDDYIYLAYEEQVGYRYSNSNRLFLESKLMQGIDPIDMDGRTEKWIDFIFYLKTYDEIYGIGAAESK